MNVKRLIYAIVASYIAMSILGMGSDMLMKESMPQMQLISRAGADLEAHFMWMMLGYFIVTIMFCYIYAHHHEGKGWKEGARYGFMIGLMMSGVTMVMYSFLPMDAMESLMSAITGIIIYVVGGAVTALVYKR